MEFTDCMTSIRIAMNVQGHATLRLREISGSCRRANPVRVPASARIRNRSIRKVVRYRRFVQLREDG